MTTADENHDDGGNKKRKRGRPPKKLQGIDAEGYGQPCLDIFND